MEEKKELKIKVQFIAKHKVPVIEDDKQVIKDGKPIMKDEIVKDAVLCKDLDGKDFLLREFGKGVSNALYRSLTRQPGDVIELRRFLDMLHDSNGKEIEIKEEYVHLVTDLVDSNYSMMISDEVHKIFDEATVMAKNDQEAKKVEPEDKNKPVKQKEDHKMKFQTTKK